jgi:hypothetical protein
MIDVIAYELQYIKNEIPFTNVELISFQKEYYSQYERIYNECFYDMRKALEIQPYNFYSDIEQMKDKIENIYLLLQDEIIIGSVACYGNEIDDLVVNKKDFFANRTIRTSISLL